MGTGFGGTYVLTTDQTRLDGKPATTGMRPRKGQVWRRQGEAIRLDGAQSTLLLDHSIGQDGLRARVSQAVRRRFELPQSALKRNSTNEPLNGFVVSDGEARHLLVPIKTSREELKLLWCPDGVPLADHDYRVISAPEAATITYQSGDLEGDVICFTEGTRIKTQDGCKLVETLEPGDYVQTMDNGMQEILWIGARRMSGARLHATPDLRPIRITAHALQGGVPDGDLLVSPHHRMLYQGANAQALFNTGEVLVQAKDMINDHTIFVDHTLREVTYHHLLFASHQIIWANGLPTESFHPANTSLGAITPHQRTNLFAHFPDLEHDQHSYGPEVRRNLVKSEAAILLHDLM